MGAVMDFDDADDDAFDDGRSDPIYLKYCFEGVATLPDLAGALRELAAELERRVGNGWTLDAPVEDGWAHLVREAGP